MLLKTIKDAYPEMPDDSESRPRISIVIPFEPKMNKTSEDSIKQGQQWILPMKAHFYNDNCIHCISEIFDGENPATGKGTIHQAWSVSALIKVLTDIKISAE